MAKKNVVAISDKREEKEKADLTVTVSIPRSLEIASKGIGTGGQFAALMSAVMSDLIDGRLTPSVGNAVCNAGGKLLKVVEMQHRWGTQQYEGGPKDLQLTLTVGQAK